MWKKTKSLFAKKKGVIVIQAVFNDAFEEALGF
jgi:hypothetical protein